jgi:hypothetical protein
MAVQVKSARCRVERSAGTASADAARAVLDADPWAGGFARLRYRVLPCALAGAAHDQQITVAYNVFDARATTSGA